MIEVSHLYKQYHRGRHTFYALQDVSFSVNQGEVLGIVGTNGSGKSTLLATLLGAVRPTSGSVRVDAAIAPLLDLGLGFCDEFTGRENVYQSAQLQGLTKRQTDSAMPSIIAFAECQDIIDTPFKRYSSGERVRLEFAVLTALDAPIALVDDVLAWADIGFLDRAFSHIKRLAETGHTVLFVSHNLKHLEICHRVMWLRKGRTEELGDLSVLAHYERSVR